MGTSVFDDPDRYRAQFRGADVDLVFTGPGDFRGRLTWVDLPNLSLLSAQDNVPRIAHLSLAPGRAFISFPAVAGAGTFWNGIELSSQEIIFQCPGGQAHARGNGPSRWRFISIDPAYLEAVGRAITGSDVMPGADRILRPSARAIERLRNLHAKACKLAEAMPHRLAHREVSRAIEQEMMQVLIDCLSARGASSDDAVLSRHMRVMMKLEKFIAHNLERRIGLPDLLAEIDIPERTLRLCCAKFLGMGPYRYLQLRRLNRIHAALQQAAPGTLSVTEIAQRYCFSELGRFAAAYRKVFGEMPSQTLRAAIQPRERGFAANA